MDTKPMTRDEINPFFSMAFGVEIALKKLPYEQATLALTVLSEMRELVGEQLPGGYHGTCIGCEEVKGEDEMVNCGDENLCRTCSDQWSKEPAEQHAP